MRSKAETPADHRKISKMYKAHLNEMFLDRVVDNQALTSSQKVMCVQDKDVVTGDSSQENIADSYL